MNVYKLTTQQNNLIVAEFHSYREENDVYKDVPPHLKLQLSINPFSSPEAALLLRSAASGDENEPKSQIKLKNIPEGLAHSNRYNLEWTSKPWINNHHPNKLSYIKNA